MAYINPRAQELAQEWMRWHRSKRIYCRPDPKNILAQFMPSKTGDAPDAELNPELYAFNTAIKSKDEKELIPFMAMYCNHRPKPVKWMAYELNINRDTFYERAHKTAADLVRMTRNLCVGENPTK